MDKLDGIIIIIFVISLNILHFLQGEEIAELREKVEELQEQCLENKEK